MNDLIERLRKENPYPSGVFLERSHADWIKFQKAVKKAGLTPDGYFGSFGRKVWDNCVDKLEKMLADGAI